MSILSDFKSKISDVVKALNLKETAKKAAISSIPVIGPTISAASTVSKLMQPKQQPQVFKVGEFSPEAQKIDTRLTSSAAPKIAQQTVQKQVELGKTEPTQFEQFRQKIIAPESLVQKAVDVIFPETPEQRLARIQSPFPTKQQIEEGALGAIGSMENISIKAARGLESFLGRKATNVEMNALKNNFSEMAKNGAKLVDITSQGKAIFDLTGLKRTYNYFEQQPTKALSLIINKGVEKVGDIVNSLTKIVNTQLLKLPKDLRQVVDSEIKLGIDLDKPVTKEIIDSNYNELIQTASPDKLEQLNQAKNLLTEKAGVEPIPSAADLNIEYSKTIDRLNENIREWFRNPDTKTSININNILESTPQVKEVPIKPPKSEGFELLERIKKAGTQLTNELRTEALAGKRESLRVATQKMINTLPFEKGTTPESTVKVYRSGTGDIKAGDQVTLDKGNAQKYLDLGQGTKIYESNVKVKDLIRNEGLKSEFIYVPKKVKEVKIQPSEIIKSTSAQSIVPKVPVKKVIPPALSGRTKIQKKIKQTIEERIPEVKITKTEKQLLIKKLTDIKSGAQVAKKVEQQVAKRQSNAYKRQIVRVEKKTRKEERTRIIDLFKKKIENVEEIKQSVINYAKDNVPLDQRGKLLEMINATKTKGDLAKSMLRIDILTRQIKSKEIVETIKKLAGDIENLPIDVKKKIDVFLSRFKFASMKDETIQRLLKSKEWMEAGNDLPNRIKMRIQMLEKTNLKDLTIDRLEEIKRVLDGYIAEGKTKARVKEEIAELRHEAMLKKLKEGSVNLDLVPIKRTPGRPSGTTWMDERKSNIANLVQSGDWQLTFMDRFFDMLDGNKHYTGINTKTFYDPIKHANDIYMNEKDKIMDQFFKLQKALNLNVYDYEKIGMYAIKQQKNGIEKLMANGYSPLMISKIHLNDREIKMYDFMRKTFDDLYPKVANKYEEQYNESLGFVENYFPFQTDFEAQDPILDQMKRMFRRTAVEKGFTKQRTLAKTPTRIDAGFIFRNYVENALQFVHMNDTIRTLGKIANDPKYGDIVGQKAQKYIQQWIDVLSRKGGVTDRYRLDLLNTIRQNLGVSMLGFKLSSALYQPLAKFNGAAEIGKWAFKYDIDFLTKPEVRKFMMDNSAELRSRIGDDPGYVDLAENPLLKTIQQKSLWALQRLDSLTAGSVWWGAYRKRLSELGLQLDLTKINQEALDYADRVVRITQASPLYKDLPPAYINKYRDLNRTLFIFQTFMLNDWNYIKHDLIRLGVTDLKEVKMMDDPNTKSKEKAKIISRISQQLLFLITAMITQEVIQGGLSKMYYGEDYQSVWNHAISALMGRVAGLSQFYSLIEYESIPVPTLSVIQNLGKGTGSLIGAEKPVTKFKGGIKVLEAIGQLTGIPGTSEMSKILRGPVPRIFEALKSKPQNPYK